MYYNFEKRRSDIGQLALVLNIGLVLVLKIVDPCTASDGDLRLGSHADLSGFPSGEVDKTCWERFLKEAPEAWAALERQLRGYQVDVIYDQQWAIGSDVRKQIDQWNVRVGSDVDQMLVLEKPSLNVAGMNENYAFRLNRTSKNHQYMLDKLQVSLSGAPPQIGSLLAYRDFINYAHSIWWVPCQLILDNLRDDGFEVILARFATDTAGHTVAQIAFRYQGELRERPRCEPGATYWAEFSPEQKWTVVRSGVSFVKGGNSKLRIRVTSSYQDWFGGTCFPEKTVLAYEDLSSKEIVEIRKIEFQQPAPLEHMTDEFYLPHYGISEAVLQSLQDTGARWRITLNAVAILVLVAAILVTRYIRQRSMAI